MGRSVQRLVLWVAIGIVALFVMFVVNQAAQLVILADRISPVLGTVTLWGLVVLFGACFVVPIVRLWRLPRVLMPPASETLPEFPRYLEQLRQRLRRHPCLKNRTIDSRADIEAALEVLGQRADAIMKQASLRVFVATAVMQNGSLDALAVIVAQSKMVFEIAHVYHQRPSWPHLVRLYANVVGSAFLARQVEEIDLVEYIQPILVSSLGPAIAATGVGGIMMNSILSGSANAYLTLRVGAVTKLYCGSLVVPSRATLRRSALLQAAKMVPSVAKEGAVQVANALTKAGVDSVKNATGALVKNVAETVKGASGELSNWLSAPFHRGSVSF